MVTVLGVNKIIATVNDIGNYKPVQRTVLVPLDAKSLPSLPSLQLVALQQNSSADSSPLPLHYLSYPIKDTIETAIQALNSSSTPLLPTSSASSTAIAATTAATPAPSNQAEPSSALQSGAKTSQATIDNTAHQVAVNVVDQSSHQPTILDATSYEEVSDEELAIFGEDQIIGPVLLEHEIAADTPYIPEWETYSVKRGDTFTKLAEQNFSMGYSDVANLLASLPDTKVFDRWRVGDRFDYQLDASGKLISLRIMETPRSGYMITRDADSFKMATIEREGEATQRLYAGKISGSFTRSAQTTGLTSTEVSELSQVLEKKIDFRRDTRRGDNFQVLVETDLIDGHYLDPRILAVNYDGEQASITLIRNPDDNKFYTPDGESLDPAFDRRPFDGSYRLSSHFNPARRHPVTGRISPHKGTDFAMPVGTSINAPSDGRVVKIGNHPAAGRYIEILHDNGYKTRYLHLSRALVKNNQRVSMGERIALSGNTGRSTGPHLHYEVLVNNRQVNAMTVPLPENRSLSGSTLVAFQATAEPLVATLESGKTGTVVANRASKNSDNSDES
nr:peptidoglycan DD-metalloendopeptidase family protein [Halomonas halocynthiae]